MLLGEINWGNMSVSPVLMTGLVTLLASASGRGGKCQVTLFVAKQTTICSPANTRGALTGEKVVHAINIQQYQHCI